MDLRPIQTTVKLSLEMGVPVKKKGGVPVHQACARARARGCWDTPGFYELYRQQKWLLIRNKVHLYMIAGGIYHGFQWK